MAEFEAEPEIVEEETTEVGVPETGPVEPVDEAQAKRDATLEEWRKKLSGAQAIRDEQEAQRLGFEKLPEEEVAEEPESVEETGEVEHEAEDTDQGPPSDAAIANARRALGRLGFKQQTVDAMAKADPAALLSWAEEAKAVQQNHESVWQENQRLKAVSEGNTEPVEQAQPAQPSVDASILANPLAEELGLDEQSGQKVANVIAQAVQAAVAPLAQELQQFKGERAERDGSRNAAILSDARKSYSKQYPELKFDETYEVVHERMVDLAKSGKYDPALDKDVKRLMRDAIKLEDLKRVENATDKRGERAKRRNSQSTTSTSRTRGKPLSEMQRKKAAFNALGKGASVQDAQRIMLGD